MRIHRPADVLAMADQLRSNLADGADQAKELLELVPRLIAIVQRTEFLLDSAERTLARTHTMVERSEALLDGLEEVAPAALPVLARVVEAIDPDEVRAVNTLIDRLPVFIEQMHDVGPNVYRILESITDLSQAVKGIPGMGALIRRGERKDEEEAIHEMRAEITSLPE
jgi:hypothetical protein